MAELGNATLIITLALAAYAVAASFSGARARLPNLVQSGRYATHLTVLTLGLGTLALVAAFLDNQFNIRYVAEHSNLAMPRIYTWVAFYAGNEGSLLFVALALSALTSIALVFAPQRLGTLRPYATGVLMLILLFFVAVMVALANPFAQFPVAPADGQGMNPLLTHPGMFIHPPMLMTGLIATAVPFSFAMGALLSRRVDDDWVDTGRIWGIVAWAILGLGLLLGAWWAYSILGWGGYWAWDPVENAAFMPWLGLTAFIHSIMVQKRRGMFRMWNMVLINISFALACFGIFINRGGPVPSVHSFGASTLGWVFLMFLGVVLVASFGLFFYRLGILKSAQRLESALSREAAFLVNNLLLLAVAFITLWGVVFPLLSEVVTGDTITVGEPFYNQVNGPLMLGLLFLMGVGPLLPWRHATRASFLRAMGTPSIVALGVVIVLAVVGVRKPYALVAFGVCAMVAGSVLQEWARGTRARHRASGASYPTAFLRLMAANRPRYGGYVAHLAIVLLAFGIVGSSFYNLEHDVILAPGQQAQIGDYEVEFVKSEVTLLADRVERTATVNVYRDGNYIDTMVAWQALYPSFRILSTRAAIRSTPVEDLYVLFSEVQPDGQSAAFRLLVNPLVVWMWISGPVLLLGTVIALWPARQRAVAYVRSPAHEAPATRTV
jgi:cytochrome c-type biogenesis protein CcmF